MRLGGRWALVSANYLYILNKSSVIINDICFIGSTLWSNVPDNFYVPKYRVRIKGFNTYLYQTNHNKDKEFIEKALQFCQRKNIKASIKISTSMK